jgi:hypothetical protein
MKHDPKFAAYTHPAGGWGSVQSLGRSLARERVPVSGARILWHQNKADGFACVSCAWAKPAKPRPFEFCEEGAKATTWEVTTRRCTPEFFAKRGGSLIRCVGTAATDKYVPVEWADAFRGIGTELQKLIELESWTDHALEAQGSGRASLEASYMYALFARLFGNNNLPDSSNMCHESTSVGMPESLGVPVGTVTASPTRRVRSRLLSGKSTPISSQYHQASLIKVHAERKRQLGHCLIEREVKPRRPPPPELPAYRRKLPLWVRSRVVAEK